MGGSVKSDMIEILACPGCQESPLEMRVLGHRQEEVIEGEMRCPHCGGSYPVRDGIPFMFPDLEALSGSHSLLSEPREMMDASSYEKHKEVAEANTAYYDAVAELYENEIEQAVHQSDSNQRRMDKIVRDLAENTQKESFLDLGCGTGNVLKFGKRYFNKAIGIDISFNMLRVATQNNLEVVQGDILFLPFKSSLFDVVSVFSVLHHIYDYTQVFDQVGRVLKPGGYLYSDWDPAKKPLPNEGRVSWRVYQLAHILFSSLRTTKRRLEVLTKKHTHQDTPIDFSEIRPDLKDIHARAEFHNLRKQEERGIDFPTMRNQLEAQGFSDIRPSYHQSGLSIDQLRGVPFLKSRLLTLLGFDPEPFLENILVLARKETDFEKNAPSGHSGPRQGRRT
jgi:ubiquinone/menaquinone biosynthesis C-methylase UbiE/uncharacterized protein YbaR (Trm112 family)